MDLEKFEKEDLPRIKEDHAECFVNDDCQDHMSLIQAFEQAMVALRAERERCAKIAEDVGYSEGLEHIDNQFLGLLRDLKDHIAEEIRSGK